MRLLILGASARAAACSAARAGLAPMAVDRFCDLDLAQRYLAQRSEEYPLDLPVLADHFPPSPWMYTGALENRASLIDKIGNVRELYGNSGCVLRKVRNPFAVAEALHTAGIPCLDVRKSRPGSRAERWVRKPLASCGGARIRMVGDMDREQRDTATAEGASPADSGVYYFQRFSAGTASSAVYVAAGGRSALLGITRQLTGESWTGATGFQYCGSIGLQPVSERLDRRFRWIGDCLAERFGLVGLFGVDAVIDGDAAWVIEVNPRYTASIEVIERVRRIRAVWLHVQACRSGRLPPGEGRATGATAGKAIVYALQNGLVSVQLAQLAARLNDDSTWPTLADIPVAGTRLRPGQPVATVLAEGIDGTDVQCRLKQLVREVRQNIKWEDPPLG